MPKLTIDGIEIEVEDGLTVLQACEAAGVEIPVSVITNACPSPAIAACAWSK